MLPPSTSSEVWRSLWRLFAGKTPGLGGGAKALWLGQACQDRPGGSLFLRGPLTCEHPWQGLLNLGTFLISHGCRQSVPRWWGPGAVPSYRPPRDVQACAKAPCGCRYRTPQSPHIPMCTAQGSPPHACGEDMAPLDSWNSVGLSQSETARPLQPKGLLPQRLSHPCVCL